MTAPDHLGNNIVLIVRHAEKPEQGSGLTPQGEARARACVNYFEPFLEAGYDVRVDALVAGADSKASIRPRLTLEPLAKATGLPLDMTVGAKDSAELVSRLRMQDHPSHPLIAWRHGHIPALLQSFGASPDPLPGGKWPDETFDWVFALTFDPAGHLKTQHLVKEHLTVTKGSAVSLCSSSRTILKLRHRT